MDILEHLGMKGWDFWNQGVILVRANDVLMNMKTTFKFLVVLGWAVTGSAS